MTRPTHPVRGNRNQAWISYFAYGSNLDEQQMRARCSSARPLVFATLHDHRLVFGGRSSTWGGAVASIVRAPGARVEGLIYQITADEILVLDRHEGRPFMYERELRLVVDDTKRPRRAAVYILRHRAEQIGAPSARYFEVLARAYRRHGFDLQPLRAAARAEPARRRR